MPYIRIHVPRLCLMREGVIIQVLFICNMLPRFSAIYSDTSVVVDEEECRQV